jgi:hypothetical protein
MEIFFGKRRQLQHQNVCGLDEFQTRNQILSYVDSKMIPLHIVYMSIYSGQKPRFFIVTIVVLQCLENCECNSSVVLAIPVTGRGGP